MNIRKGDKVKILSGKDRGKDGKVIRVIPKEGRVVVDGLNLIKKHKKSQKRGQKGERVTVSGPMNVSNVQLICPKCGKPSRIGHKMINDKKVRICKKCQGEV
ncbi:MAG: 50S ribosomal protein L24 [Patescibacteria group bacterium]|jgi:large subunit ribosomal protein L24|nr:50S ribosomal protein L24 [Patescibacteria group bacterium]